MHEDTGISVMCLIAVLVEFIHCEMTAAVAVSFLFQISDKQFTFAAYLACFSCRCGNLMVFRVDGNWSDRTDQVKTL
jgi:hypothetical protein